MRRPVTFGVLLSLASCDRVLGIDERMADAPPIDVLEIDAVDGAGADRDMDGTSDDVDLCIAPANEGSTTDFDQDIIVDAIDTCPYDNVNGIDGSDMDGIAFCDPYPTVPDRSRCLMLFTSSALNSALWLPRSPDHSWSNEPTKLIAAPPNTGNTLATTIVAQSLERAGITSYDASFDVTQGGSDGSITLWLRANPSQFADSDIGCRYLNVAGAATLAVVRGSTPSDVDGTSTLPVDIVRGYLRGRIVATGALGSAAQVTCELRLPGFQAFSTASVPLAEGRLGFTVDRWLVAVRAMHIIDQP